MKYIIGIDGGGTKTDCAIADLSGKIIRQTEGKPSNFLVIGVEEAVENIFGLIEENLFTLEKDFSDVKQIVIGVAGAGREDDARLLEKSFSNYSEQQSVHFRGVKVVSDAQVALEGAFGGKAGCIIIAGTGSILFGKDKNGFIHRSGGFGRLIGDEGSGHSVGRKGLSAVAKDLDGRGKATLITQLLNKKYNISSAPDLIMNVYKNNFDIASAAEVVLSAADENDAVALQILNEEADELLLHINAVMKKIKSKKLDIAFTGNLIANKNIYSDMLRKKFADNFPSVKIKESDNTPVKGAIFLAKEMLNV
ncbi:MAG: BadF/BadG/BcrA/BcrD ATPase family protein [Ignavibacteriaceae bacterium]|jgi:N-acetylglucosamine kinase-like BadF-type ATPase